MSRGEFDGVRRAVGGIAEMVNESAKDRDTLALMNYLSDSDREEKLFENQQLIRTPVVRNGKKATIGYCPEVWAEWE